MKKFVWMALPVAALGATCTSAYSQDAASSVAAPISPAQSIAKAYTTTTDMRFRTINYSNMVCTDPRYAVRANIITSGIPDLGPELDSKWLQAQKDNKNCFQIAPDLAFHVTNAFAVYAGEMGAVWVVGVIAKGGHIAGYIPIDDIQFIPLPTL